MPAYHKLVLIVGIIAVIAIAAILVVGRIVETRVNPGSSLKPGERVENDGTGKQIKSVMFEADVLSWNPAGGILTVSRDGKKQEVKIVLPQTVLLIATAGAGDKSGMLTPVRSTEEDLWRTAFCPGDKATIMLPSAGGNQAVIAPPTPVTINTLDKPAHQNPKRRVQNRATCPGRKPKRFPRQTTAISCTETLPFQVSGQQRKPLGSSAQA